MTFSTINRGRNAKPQRGVLLAAILGVWAMPVQAQTLGPAATDVIAKQDDVATKSPPPEFMRDFSIDGVAKEDATAIRYEGGVFQESTDGWTETRDSGEVFTYDLVTDRPGGNALVFHDADRNVGASISFANGAIFVRDARGTLLRSHEATAVEAVPRAYPRPRRSSMDDLQTASFEGGQLRRSLYGRWIRRNDDGQCTTYRLWNTDMAFFSIWDEENDIVLTIFVDTMQMFAERLNAGERSPLDGLRLTEVSGERDFEPMRDCNDPPSQVSVPPTGEGSGDFPLASFVFRSGLFSRVSDSQWSHLPGHGDFNVGGSAALVYDVLDSSENHLLAYSEANDVYARVELDNRSLLIFSLNGVVDQFYPITTTTPEFAWETASQRRNMTGTDMTTIDYEGGQFRKLTVGRWVDISEENGCSYYEEWGRHFGGVTLLSQNGRRSPRPRISFNVFGMTATVHGGFANTSPVVETRQLTAIGDENLGEDPAAICRAG